MKTTLRGFLTLAGVMLFVAAPGLGQLDSGLGPSPVHAETSDTASVQELQQKIEDLKLELADREEKIADLEEGGALDRPVHPEVQRLRRTVQELKTTVKKKNKTIEQLNAQLEEGGAQSQEIQETLKSQKSTIEELETRNEQLEEQLNNVRELTDERKNRLKDLQNQLEDVQEADATQVGGEVTITLDEAILFKLGEATLKEDAKSTLDELTDVFQKHEDYRILVEGHTDDVPVGGTQFSSNWSLSVQRAANVVEYLQANSSIPGEKLMAAGLGSNDPIAPNDTPENRAKNRRVEIKLIPTGHLEKDQDSQPDSNTSSDSQ